MCLAGNFENNAPEEKQNPQNNTNAAKPDDNTVNNNNDKNMQTKDIEINCIEFGRLLKVVRDFLVIIIAISPGISIYLILSYLNDYNAKVIGYNILFNISSLSVILIYGLTITLIISLILFIIPIVSGYVGELNEPSNVSGYVGELNEPSNNLLSALKKFKIDTNRLISFFKRKSWDEMNMSLLLAITFLIVIFEILKNTLIKYYVISATIELVILTFFIKNLIKLYFLKKEHLKLKCNCNINLFSFYSLIFLFFLYYPIILAINSNIFPLHWAKLILLIYIIVLIIMLYILGYRYANNRNKKGELKFFISIISIIFITVFLYVNQNFQYSKIIMQLTGLGNYHVKINLKSKLLPRYLKNEIIENIDTNKHKKNKNTLRYINTFLLIQTTHSYYIRKTNNTKLNNVVIRLPIKYTYNIEEIK